MTVGDNGAEDYKVFPIAWEQDTEDNIFNYLLLLRSLGKGTNQGTLSPPAQA